MTNSKNINENSLVVERRIRTLQNNYSKQVQTRYRLCVLCARYKYVNTFLHVWLK